MAREPHTEGRRELTNKGLMKTRQYGNPPYHTRQGGLRKHLEIGAESNVVKLIARKLFAYRKKNSQAISLLEIGAVVHNTASQTEGPAAASMLCPTQARAAKPPPHKLIPGGLALSGYMANASLYQVMSLS